MKSILKMILPILLLLSIAGCGIKYCSVPNCPKEAFAHSSYCPEHKCPNTSCKNRAIRSYSYCKECIERSMQK